MPGLYFVIEDFLSSTFSDPLIQNLFVLWDPAEAPDNTAPGLTGSDACTITDVASSPPATLTLRLKSEPELIS